VDLSCISTGTVNHRSDQSGPLDLTLPIEFLENCLRGKASDSHMFPGKEMTF